MSEFKTAYELQNLENCSGYKTKLRLLDKRASIKKKYELNLEKQRNMVAVWKQKRDIKLRYKKNRRL